MGFSIHSLKLTYGWLEDDPFLWKALFLVSGTFFFHFRKNMERFGTTPQPPSREARGGSQRAFKVTEDLDNPELAFWGGVATGTIFVSLLICLKHLGDHMQFFFWKRGKKKRTLGIFWGLEGSLNDPLLGGSNNTKNI